VHAASHVFHASGKLTLFAGDGQGVQPWVHDWKLLPGWCIKAFLEKRKPIFKGRQVHHLTPQQARLASPWRSRTGP
jgi:hypothetical protein